LNSKTRGSVYFATVITFCSLYAAQPIQPLFKQEFSLSHFQAILFTALIMAPLGFAPLFYGYVLEAFSAKKLVRMALLVLALLELGFSMAGNYSSLLLIRGIQGMIIPAILTSLMSYISYASEREKVQHAIAAYIGATILGGFLGRFLSGLLTDLFGWRFFFFLLGLLLLLTSFLLKDMVDDVKTSYARPRLKEMTELLGVAEFRWLYTTIFCLFFVFAALMNFLPFELKQLAPGAGETRVGLLYLGYSMGILVSLNSRRILNFFGSEVKAIRAGIYVFACGTFCFMVEDYMFLFGAMFIFCAGLFTAHSLLSGFVNKIARQNKAIANGLYICFYYTGGTLGSLLPGAVYKHFGWQPFLLQLLFMIAVSLFSLSLLARAVHR
jgi:YNFM family putative membrane transporter